MGKRLHRAVGVALAAALAIVFVMRLSGHAEEMYERLGLLTEVLRDITTQYVDEVPAPELVHNAMVGMLDGLEGDSELLDPRHAADADGGNADVGLVLTRRRDELTVVAALDDTPARRAGLAAGDRILKIDGVDTKTMERSAAVARLRGEAGTTVSVTIMRHGWGEPAVLTLTRERFGGPTVLSRLERGGMRYIRIRRFAPTTPRELTEALSGPPARGLVLDLRNEPGGSASDAVALAERFLEPGRLITYLKGRRPEFYREFRAAAGGPRIDVPVALLVNEGSAGAAEIAAGALQDWRRAVLVGTRTFGEAAAQSVIPLSGGGWIRLTTARYFTPRGQAIDGHGVTPDIEVAAAPGGGDAQLQRALEVLEIAQVIEARR